MHMRIVARSALTLAAALCWMGAANAAHVILAASHYCGPSTNSVSSVSWTGSDYQISTYGISNLSNLHSRSLVCHLPEYDALPASRITAIRYTYELTMDESSLIEFAGPLRLSAIPLVLLPGQTANQYRVDIALGGDTHRSGRPRRVQFLLRHKTYGAPLFKDPLPADASIYIAALLPRAHTETGVSSRLLSVEISDVY